MVPTARAEAMAGPLAHELAAIEGTMFAPLSFDPTTAKRTNSATGLDSAELWIHEFVVVSSDGDPAHRFLREQLQHAAATMR